MPSKEKLPSCLDFINTPADRQGFDAALRRALGSPERDWRVRELLTKHPTPATVDNKELLFFVGHFFGISGGSTSGSSWNENHAGGANPKFWAHPTHVCPDMVCRPVTGAALCAAVRRVLWPKKALPVDDIAPVSEDAEAAFLARRRAAKADSLPPASVGDLIRFGFWNKPDGETRRVVRVTKIKTQDEQGRALYNISYSHNVNPEDGDGPTSSWFACRRVGERVLAHKNNFHNFPGCDGSGYYTNELFIVGNVNNPKPEQKVVNEDWQPAMHSFSFNMKQAGYGGLVLAETMECLIQKATRAANAILGRDDLDAPITTREDWYLAAKTVKAKSEDGFAYIAELDQVLAKEARP